MLLIKFMPVWVAGSMVNNGGVCCWPELQAAIMNNKKHTARMFIRKIRAGTQILLIKLTVTKSITG